MNEPPQTPLTPDPDPSVPKADPQGAMEDDPGVSSHVIANPVSLSALDTTQAVKTDPDAQDLNLKMIMDIPVDVHVEIGQTRLSIRDILRLGAGSVVELDRLAGQSADIVVNGKMVGQGDVVVVNETFGIRITKLVGVQERIRSL